MSRRYRCLVRTAGGSSCRPLARTALLQVLFGAVVAASSATGWAVDVIDAGANGANGANGFLSGNPSDANGRPGNTAPLAIAAAISSDSSNTAIANAGTGGTGGNGVHIDLGGGLVLGGHGGNGGMGGAAYALAETTSGVGPATAIARTNQAPGAASGGVGGNSHFSSFSTTHDGSGGPGGDSTAGASASNTGPAPVYAEASARGGDGGVGGWGTGTESPGYGGQGGSATLAQVSGVSLGGGDVTVLGVAEGGNGGLVSPAFPGYSGAPPASWYPSNGIGGNVTLDNSVNGHTSGNLTLTQVAVGGDSPDGPFALQAGGSAYSELELDKFSASLTATSIAEAGRTGQLTTPVTELPGEFPYQLRADGGSAESILSATNRTGGVDATVTARAGDGSFLGAGGVVRLTGAALALGAGAHPAALTMNAEAGHGSTGWLGGAGGGVVLSSPANVGQVAESLGGGPATLRLNAMAGNGGDAVGSAAMPAGNGGTGGGVELFNGPIQAIGYGTAPVSVEIELTGGNGGYGQGAESAGGGTVMVGAQGVSMGSGPVSVQARLTNGNQGATRFTVTSPLGSSLDVPAQLFTGTSNGGAVDVSATFNSGDSGSSTEGTGRAAKVITAINAVDGATTGAIRLSQAVNGGRGGDSAVPLAAPHPDYQAGGGVTNELLTVKSAESLLVETVALGGDGGDAAGGLPGVAGGGGFARAFSYAENLSGPAQAIALATGGNGGHVLGTAGATQPGAAGSASAVAKSSANGEGHAAISNATAIFGQADAGAASLSVGFAIPPHAEARAYTDGQLADATAVAKTTLSDAVSVESYGVILSRANAAGTGSGSHIFASAESSNLGASSGVAARAQGDVSGGTGVSTWAAKGELAGVSQVFGTLDTGISGDPHGAAAAVLWGASAPDAAAAGAKPMLGAAGFGSATTLGSATTFNGAPSVANGQSHAYRTQATFTIPSSELAAPGHIQLGLTQAALTGAGVEQLQFTVRRNGVTVVDRHLGSADQVMGFFNDRLLDLGAAPQAGSATPVEIQISLESTNQLPGNGVDTLFALANLPVPRAHLAVTSFENRSVSVLDLAGGASLLAEAQDGLLSPLGIAISPDGDHLHVADFLLSKVWSIDAQAAVTTLAGPAQGIATPVGLASGAANTLEADYLTGAVRAIDSLGQTTIVAGPAQGVTRPFDVAVDSLGNTFVADLEGRKILRITPQGASSVWADASDGLLAPVGLAVNASDEVFVSDALSGRITRFDAVGIGSTFADVGDGLITPAGMTFDEFGYLYVADYLGNAVRRFDSAGLGAVFADHFRPWDVAALGANWGSGGAGFAPVPEPGAAGPLGLGLAVVAFRGRRQRARRQRTANG